MVSSSDYKKLLKDHAKFKVIKRTSPQILNEEDRGILINVKIKRLQRKISELENKMNSCNNKIEKVTIEMTLKKEEAKLKSLLNN